MIKNSALEAIAIKSIPEGNHPLLRVNSRRAWVKMVTELLKTGKIEATTKNIKRLSEKWEPLLITHYSVLN
jgi:ribosomal protein L17